MQRTRFLIVGVLVAVAAGIGASSAAALTLGTTTLPSGGTLSACITNTVFVQTSTDSAFTYAVPAGGGAITSWSTNVTGAAPGSSLSLLVLRPAGAAYSTVGFDTETIPNPLPASGVVTFPLASPISVSGGELLGLFSPTTGARCFFSGGGITTADVLMAGVGTAAPPSAGATYTATTTGNSLLVDVAAELQQGEDVALSGSATPSSITAGGASDYAFTVTNKGPSSAPITFADTVANGLTIIAAVAGSGHCSTAGQAVTCTISGLASGASAPVSIFVSAANAGTYSNTALVSSAPTDPNPADNALGATLTVVAPAVAPPPSCKTVGLAGTPLPVAKVVITALNCKVGNVQKKHSKHVRRGNVISTSPGAGKTLANGSAVNITVSSGPPKKKKKK